MKLQYFTIAYKKPSSGRLKHIVVGIKPTKDQDPVTAASKKVKDSHLGQELAVSGYLEYGISKGAMFYARKRR